jgi:isoleucyl-tRNA synthetase
MSFKSYKQLDLVGISKEVLGFWTNSDVFNKSINIRSKSKPFVFYEGPPSANGRPGIHHAMARTIKDIVCRYKTMQGFRVERKAGWDTHGLPVELGVEKELNITKEDIGKKISIEAYNHACREAVMRYTDQWKALTQGIGYWVDMDRPYVTYHSKYIESVWYILKNLYDKDFLYKGFTIQPYSPKAGTGLSSHELNQPGTYKEVKDTSITAQFKLVCDERFDEIFGSDFNNVVYALAWTTTPWTLPSNTALTIGSSIRYALVETINRYTETRIYVLIALDRLGAYLNISPSELEEIQRNHFPLELSDNGSRIAAVFTGAQLVGLRYEQLLPYASPAEDADKAFHIISGDFVTTQDGTGIVHTAPTFGADDMRVAKSAGIPPMLVCDEDGHHVPLVDLQGKFTKHMGEFAGKYVKNEYYNDGEAPVESVDVEIAMKLKREGMAFKIEKYVHTYPHCWRTDKPILYYPLNSWFVRTTAIKDKLIENNNTINWKPASTGTGRFGNWLENLQDWNLSRSRFWGIPLPIWTSEDKSCQKIIGSIGELKMEIEKAITAGIEQKNMLSGFIDGSMDDENYDAIDLHKHIVDQIILVSNDGKLLYREPDLIDVWFDSGAMPFAQWHFPFENKEKFEKGFPADFIAEGVDQTRGWFFTLHAIAAMFMDSVAYKNVISNGLVLDKHGQKMSKRLGNAVDPFEILDKYGPDALRWYMVTNAQPWDNLKFDVEGIIEVQRKFFRALYNTYSFFVLYANVDGFVPTGERIAASTGLPDIDRWVLSKLETLKEHVYAACDAYEITTAARHIQDFVVDDLSNWWVRQCRKRFWRGEMGEDKILAYRVLYTCLDEIALLMAPFAPFYAERLYRDLHPEGDDEMSVHTQLMPRILIEMRDEIVEQRMDLARRASSLILGIRKKENIKVRQPLSKAVIAITSEKHRKQLSEMSDVVKLETNIKALEFVAGESDVIKRKAKPNFRALGGRVGGDMKQVATAIASLSQEELIQLESGKDVALKYGEKKLELHPEEIELVFEEIPGFTVAGDGVITLALDVEISEELLLEGIARELINRIQNLRKDSGLEVTDRINIRLSCEEKVSASVNTYLEYIRAETLTDTLEIVQTNLLPKGVTLDFNDFGEIQIDLEKANNGKPDRSN